ncbi:LUD domain-containing protein [Streptomyces sp. 7R007]
MAARRPWTPQQTVRRYSGPDVVALFGERTAEYGAMVVRLPAARAAATHRSTLAGPADAVVATSATAIALTGTVILDHGSGQGRRVLTLLLDQHIRVVRADCSL